MSNFFAKSVFQTVSKVCIRASKKRLSNNLLVLLASATGLFAVDAAVLSKATPAAFSINEPILLAQQPNSRVAHMVCGPYDVVIRYLGNDEFSYQTRGLYLENGYSSINNTGDIVYDFFNSDFEYRVLARLDGTGTLMVAKYGETLMTKSCTWD